MQAWDSISTELIKKSFKCCGIGLPADGSEDNAIHAFKPNRPYPGGMRKLAERRQQVHVPMEISAQAEERYDSDQVTEDENLD